MRSASLIPVLFVLMLLFGQQSLALTVPHAGPGTDSTAVPLHILPQQLASVDEASQAPAVPLHTAKVTKDKPKGGITAGELFRKWWFVTIIVVVGIVVFSLITMAVLGAPFVFFPVFLTYALVWLLIAMLVLGVTLLVLHIIKKRRLR